MVERYIGIEQPDTSLAVISEKGRKLKDFPVETNGQALAGTCACVGEHHDASPSKSSADSHLTGNPPRVQNGRTTTCVWRSRWPIGRLNAARRA